MRSLISIFIVVLANSSISPYNDSSQIDEVKIADAIRKAVRNADSTLLKTTALSEWRDYVKIATLQLEPEIRPLALIKFDEDVTFRNQLKAIIEYEKEWKKLETEHYIYYFRWDQPLPKPILGFQDVHYKKLAQFFEIENSEKIPYRYDPQVGKASVYPLQELMAGIISPQPFDLDKAAHSILFSISSEPPCLIQPLARIYGSYFQNESTAQAYFEKSLNEVQPDNYYSILTLYSNPEFEPSQTPEWYSAYIFVFALNQRFGPSKIAQFLKVVDCETHLVDFKQSFQEIFKLPLEEFETQTQKAQSKKAVKN